VSSNSTDRREIRKFGTIALIFFGCLAALGIFTGKKLPVVLFGFLAALGISFILVPDRLAPVYKMWLKIGHVIGKIITTLILTVLYFLVMTPATIIKRFLGGRPLPIKPDKTISSYWVTRDEPAQPRDRFFKRY
jgi:hypothetical protein